MPKIKLQKTTNRPKPLILLVFQVVLLVAIKFFKTKTTNFREKYNFLTNHTA
ncbi:protein of unknown function [Streptococcus thermophilus]|nr:protein of unknown function [Streptococcus thermophilus]